MNTDKGNITGEPVSYRLIDLFTDLAGRIHTYGPNAAISYGDAGWKIEDHEAGPGERRILGAVCDLAEALKSYSPDEKVVITNGYLKIG